MQERTLSSAIAQLLTNLQLHLNALRKKPRAAVRIVNAADDSQPQTTSAVSACRSRRRRRRMEPQPNQSQ